MKIITCKVPTSLPDAGKNTQDIFFFFLTTNSTVWDTKCLLLFFFWDITVAHFVNNIQTADQVQEKKELNTDEEQLRTRMW